MAEVMNLRWWTETGTGEEINVFETDVPNRDHAVAILASELVAESSDAFMGKCLTEFVLSNRVKQDEGYTGPDGPYTFHVTLT